MSDGEPSQAKPTQANAQQEWIVGQLRGYLGRFWQSLKNLWHENKESEEDKTAKWLDETSEDQPTTTSTQSDSPAAN